MHSAWFNHTTFAGGAFVPPSCCVLLNDDPRRPLYRDETQCQIEALLSANASFGDDANVKTRGCYDAVVAWLRRYEYLSSYVYVSIVLQVRIIARAPALLRLRCTRKNQIVVISSETKTFIFSDVTRVKFCNSTP